MQYTDLRDWIQKVDDWESFEELMGRIGTSRWVPLPRCMRATTLSGNSVR